MAYEIAQGGTGQTTAAGARIALGLGPNSSPTFTNLTLTGNADIGGTLEVTGLSTLASLTVTGAFALTGDDVQVSEGGTGVSTITGIVTGNGTAALVGRTLTAPAAGFTITNANGATGNPTFVLANDLAALEGLGSTGFAVRSAANTWVQRTLTGTANEITVGDGDGISGNPVFSLPSALTFTGKTITGGTYIADALSLETGVPIFTIKDTNSVGTAATAYMEFRDSGNTRLGFMGMGSTGNSDVYVVSDSGDIRLTPSSDVVNLTEGQLKFPAIQNPSADVNTLDDYEENTWSPTLNGTSGGTPTYTSQDGYYIKIGQHVTVWFWLVVTLGSVTGQLRIGSLPFARASGIGQRAYMGVPFFSNITGPAGSIGMHGFFQDAGTDVRLYAPTISGQSAILNTHVTGIITIYGTMTYQADA